MSNQNQGASIEACSSCSLTMEESHWLAARRTPAATTGELPPLPEPHQTAGKDAGCWFPDFFDAGQMKAYARAAIEADRAQPAPTEQNQSPDSNVLPPFAAPADQHEADTVAEITFLTEWLQFIGEPVGVECCGRGYGNGECCDNPVPVTVTLPELEKAMNERLNVLVAKLPASGFREGRNAQPEISAGAATTSNDARDAAKWRMLPAVAEDHQINLLKLYRDIDSAMSAHQAKKTEGA